MIPKELAKKIREARAADAPRTPEELDRRIHALIEQLGDAGDGETHHVPPDMVGVIVGRQHAGERHVIGSEDLDEAPGIVCRIDDHGLADLAVADGLGDRSGHPDFEILDDGCQKTRRLDTRDDAVIETQRQRQHAMHGNAILYRDRAPLDAARTEDRNLRRYDDELGEPSPEHTEIAERDRLANEPFPRQRAGIHGAFERLDLLPQVGEVASAGVGDDRREQPFVGLDGDAEIDPARGQRVASGDVLLELDPRSAQADIERLRTVRPGFKPLLIGQGANDPRVKQAESDQIVEAMEKHEVPVTYVLFPDEGHGFHRPENNIAFNAIAENFLAEPFSAEDAGRDTDERIQNLVYREDTILPPRRRSGLRRRGVSSASSRSSPSTRRTARPSGVWAACSTTAEISTGPRSCSRWSIRPASSSGTPSGPPSGPSVAWPSGLRSKPWSPT
mgnify:CR=1 FL=1